MSKPHNRKTVNCVHMKVDWTANNANLLLKKGKKKNWVPANLFCHVLFRFQLGPNMSHHILNLEMVNFVEWIRHDLNPFVDGSILRLDINITKQ